MQNVAAEFTIGQRPTINAEFSIEENRAIDTIFEINASPTKVSQLENDVGYQTEEQVSQAIEIASETINERIDGVVEAFDSDIENINERMIDTILGSELIGVTRYDNTVTLTSSTFIFEQGIASDTWLIEHNLGKKPSITVVDSADTVIGVYKADYDGENKITLKFNGAFTGKAYLN